LKQANMIFHWPGLNPSIREGIAQTQLALEKQMSSL